MREQQNGGKTPEILRDRIVERWNNEISPPIPKDRTKECQEILKDGMTGYYPKYLAMLCCRFTSSQISSACGGLLLAAVKSVMYLTCSKCYVWFTVILVNSH